MSGRENSGIKANIAQSKVCADLLIKGHLPFVPTGEYYTPFDLLVVTKNKRYLKLQVKYITDGKVPNGTAGGYNGSKSYKDGDFEYYAIYLPTVDAVIYPSFKFKGCVIATKPRKSATEFWWYKDFLDFTDTVQKRSYKEFNITLKGNTTPRIGRRKCIHPSKEELEKMLWMKPTTQIAQERGVSDNAVARWAKEYGIDKPPRGYWMKKK